MSTIVPTQPWYLRALTTAGLLLATTLQGLLLAIALWLGWYDALTNEHWLAAWLLLGVVFTINLARDAAGLPLPGLPYDVIGQRWLLGSQTGASIGMLACAYANAALPWAIGLLAAGAAHHGLVLWRHGRRQRPLLTLSLHSETGPKSLPRPTAWQRTLAVVHGQRATG